MIAICVTNEEAEISGTVEELLEVGLTITALVSSPERSVTLPLLAHDPAPYEQALSELTIVRGSGPTLVSVHGPRLTVLGSDRSLVRFASWFQFPHGAQAGQHSHFEPLPGDPDHSAASVALVVSVRHAGA